MRRRLALLLVLAGCTGETELRVFGESFAEEGIPAAELRDGWEVRFDELLVALGDVRVSGDPSSVLGDWHVFDIAVGSGGAGHLLSTLVDQREIDGVHFRVGSPGTVAGGNASNAQAEMLRDSGFAIFASGEASKDGQTVGFEWGIPMDLSYDCPVDANERGAPETVELTMHADHLFADDLEVAPELAFDVVAGADNDRDGLVTPDELRDVELATLSAYQTSRADIEDLWTFIGNLALTIPHVDGEGTCSQRLTPDEFSMNETPIDYDPGLAGELYAQHCALCHGDTGRGDGPGGEGTRPAPTDLTGATGSAADPSYIRFRIARGGAFFPYASSMIAYENVLSDDEIGQLTAYVAELAGP